MVTGTLDRPHREPVRYNRVGEPVEGADTITDAIPHGDARPVVVRCVLGYPVARDGSCCLRHDMNPHLTRH